MCWWRLWARGFATAERRSGIAIPSRGQPKDPQEALSPALHLVALHCSRIKHHTNGKNGNDNKPACFANKLQVRLTYPSDNQPINAQQAKPTCRQGHERITPLAEAS